MDSRGVDNKGAIQKAGYPAKMGIGSDTLKFNHGVLWALGAAILNQRLFKVEFVITYIGCSNFLIKASQESSLGLFGRTSLDHTC